MSVWFTLTRCRLRETLWNHDYAGFVPVNPCCAFVNGLQFNKELRLYNGFLYLNFFTVTTCFDYLQASRINLQRKRTSFQLRTGTALYEYFTYAEHCNIEKLRVYIPRKNSVIPLLILFKICGSVRLCTLFVILYKLPEGGWLYTTLETLGTSD
jgi:hypothetical protein